MTDSKKKETEFEKQVIKDEAEAEKAHSKLTKESVQPLNSTEAKNADSVTTSSPAKSIPEPTGKNVSASNPLSVDKKESITGKTVENSKEFDPSFDPSHHPFTSKGKESVGSKEQSELLKEMNEIIEECGGETNVPLGSKYWALRDQYRSTKSQNQARMGKDTSKESK